MAKMYKNDVGTVIRVHTNLGDVSATYEIKKPSGATVSWTPTEHVNTADDNYFNYVVQAGDLDEIGIYKGHIKNSGFYSEMFQFEVYNEYL